MAKKPIHITVPNLRKNVYFGRQPAIHFKLIQ